MPLIKKKNQKWVALLVIAVALPVILGGIAITDPSGLVNWWASLVPGNPWGGGSETGDTDLPRITVALECVEMYEEGTGVTCDSVRIFDQNFKPLGGDSSADATGVSITGIAQGQNVWVYVEDSTSYPHLFQAQTPRPGPNPGTTSHTMEKPDGYARTPVKLLTAYVDDYCLYGSTSLAGSNYNFTTSGQTPTFQFLLNANELSANTQDRVWGADYIEPEQGKRHVAVLVIRSSVSGNIITSPGWQKVSDMTYDYWYKIIEPWHIDQTADGLYSQSAFSIDVTFYITDSASDAATLLYNWIDDMEEEEIAKINWGTVYDTGTITIQD